MRSFEEIKEIRKDVAERYPKITFPNVVLEPLWWGRRPPTNRVTDRFAIVDQTTDVVYNVCTDAYKPIFHEEVIHLVEQATAKTPEYGKPEITVNLLQDGGKLRVTAKFPEVQFDINPKVGDIINPTIYVASSYDLGWKYGGKFGAFRLVCSNGATVGVIFDSFKKRHLNSLDPNALTETITSGMLKFSEQTDLWKKWVNEQITGPQYEQLWTELPFSAPEKEKIEALPEAATKILLPVAMKANTLTKWGMFNVVTQYATHEISSELRRIEIQPAITAAFEKVR